MLTSLLVLLALPAAHAGPPPSRLTSLFDGDPNATVFVDDEGAMSEVVGWLGPNADVQVLAPGETPADAVGAADPSRCWIHVRSVMGGWNIWNSPACEVVAVAPAPAAVVAAPTAADPTDLLAQALESDPAVAPTDAGAVQPAALTDAGETQAAAPPDAGAAQAAAPTDAGEAQATAPPVTVWPAPEPAPENSRVRERRRAADAQAAMVLFGGAYGGYAAASAGWLVGEALEESEEGHTVQGAVAGGLPGAVTGGIVGQFLYAGAEPEVEAVALLYTATLTGGYYGEQLGRMLIPYGDAGAFERIRAAGLAGSMAGLGVAAVSGERASDVGSQVNFGLATGVGWLAGRGVSDAALWERDRRQQQAIIQSASSAVLGGVAVAYNRSGAEAPTATTVGLGLADGLWFGLWSPFLFTDDPDARQIAGGAELGAGLGYGVGMGIAALGNPSPKSVALQAAGLASGSALGAGIPLAIGGDGPLRAVVAPMMAGGATGQVLGALAAPRYELHEADSLLVGSLTAWTVYQSAGWAAAATQLGVDETQSIGFAMTAAGAGSLATLALAPAVDLSPEGSVMLLSGGAWGTWFGTWGATLTHAEAHGTLMSGLIAGDGGLVVSAVAQGAGWKPTWKHAGTINGMGLLGAAGGGLIGVVALYDPEDMAPISAAVMAGSGAGLVAGAVLGARPGSGKGIAKLGSFGLGERLPVAARLQASPWASEAGDPGVWVQLDLADK